MDIAKKIADSIFEDESTSELAIQIYDRLVEQLRRNAGDMPV